MVEHGLTDIWVYLSASPLLGLTMTLVAYGLAHRLYLRARANPLVNPVVGSVALLITVLMATGTSYEDYFEGAQFVHFLLGPATVALAVPLYQQLSRLRQLWLPVAISLLSGVVIAAGSSIWLARLFGRFPGNSDVPGAEIGDRAGGHGHCRENRRAAVPDCGAGGAHGCDRGGAGNQAVRLAAGAG